jgi:tRNA modification GTPase
MLSDTIAALATARGPSALAVVRLSGPRALAIAESVFRPAGRIAALSSHTCAVGAVADAGEELDQVVVTVFRAPHSYTGEDCVEISCHGGSLTSARILSLLERQGARPAREGEFTLRAFLHGKMDLAQAEAVEALIRARSTAGARAAMRVLQGGLGEALEPLLSGLTATLARIESALDIQIDGAPDVLEVPARNGAAEGSAAARVAIGRKLAGEEAKLGALLAGSRGGRLLEEGLHVAIVGRPNAGKSSLFNALLARQRAIVSAEPGTTRDALEGWVEWDGLPVALHDTAGLREPETDVEREGVRRTHAAIAAGSLVILVVDISQDDPASAPTVLAHLGHAPEQLIIALHKWDLGASPEWQAVAQRGQLLSTSGEAGGAPVVPSSVVGSGGIDRLTDELKRVLASGVGDPREALIVGERQRQLIAAAREAIGRAREIWDGGGGDEMAAFELRSGLDKLGEILGRAVGPEVLEEIFARFCVGK